MKQILVFIFDGYADWEPAYVCAQLNAPGTGYAVKTIGLDRAPKVSMGGFRVTPDFTVADYPRGCRPAAADRRDSVAGAEK